jgi:hypothetical protein
MKDIWLCGHLKYLEYVVQPTRKLKKENSKSGSHWKEDLEGGKCCIRLGMGKSVEGSTRIGSYEGRYSGIFSSRQK